MNRDDVHVSDTTTLFEGHARMDGYRLRHTQHAGGVGPWLEREVLERGQVAAVLPVDPARGEVILVEQFRVGAYAAGLEPWLLECIAGIIEAGQSARDVAVREALEEAGCAVTDLVEIGRFIMSPGISTETVTLFCGRTSTANAGGIHGLVEEGEDIRVHVVGVDDAVRMVADGRVINAKTVIALQWLAANLEHLEQRW